MPSTTAKKRSRRTTAPTKKSADVPEKATVKKLPGYWQHSKDVWLVLWGQRRLFLRLALLAWGVLMVMRGIQEISQYNALSDATHDAVATIPDGFMRVMVATGILLSSTLTGSLSSGLGEGQAFASWLVTLLLWLTVVWLIRHLLAGTKITIRDGLYNSGAPLISTVLVIGYGIIQLLPLALLVAFFSALSNTGAFSHPFVTLLMVMLSLGLAVVTVYWLTTTFMALIITTIPGTYPMAAIRSARSVAKGYRATVLLRLLWLGLLIGSVTVITLGIATLIDATSGLSNGFIVVVLAEFLTVTGLIYASAYIYQLYRRIIDERAD